MAPKAKEAPPAEEEEQEEEEVPPEPPEVRGEETELETGLQLLLRPKDVEAVWALKGQHAPQGKLLESLLGLRDAYPAEAQRSIISDYHLFSILHAHSICLDRRQGAVFHTIMAQILAMMKSPEKISENQLHKLTPASACFKEFERLILTHAVQDPPSEDGNRKRLAVFNGSEVRLLTDFASATLFKHFLLYQFCINFDRQVQALRFSVDLDRPLPAPDLITGRMKPRKRSQEQSVDGAEGGSDMDQTRKAENTGDEQEELTEEQEIERLVEEKLRETEQKLQQRLDDRAERFKSKLADSPKAKAKGK